MEKQIKIALAGNPNSGKTTLFNALTGSNQFVGNWPGVTVEKKQAPWKKDRDVELVDLPGIYSLSPYSPEEVVSRDFLVNDRPDAVVDLIDVTNLERNLYLTTQVLEAGRPVVVGLNMCDLLKERGDAIDAKKLSSMLGVPVVEVSALRNRNLDKLMQQAVDAARDGVATKGVRCFSPEVESALQRVQAIVGDAAPADLARWYAIKVFERDADAIEPLALSKAQLDAAEEVIAAVEKSRDDDAESIVTGERYDCIATVMDACVKKAPKRLTTSQKIDRVVTNRVLGLPIFAAVMIAVYWVALVAVGTPATDWVNDNLFSDGFFVNSASQQKYDADTAAYEDGHYADKIDGFLAAADEKGIDTSAASKALAADTRSAADERAIKAFEAEAAGVVARDVPQYDGDGKLNNWWTDEDRKNFEARTGALIAQYNSFVPLQLAEKYADEPDKAPHVNGALTIGENIGDLGGVNIALKAYAFALGKAAGKSDAKEDGSPAAIKALLDTAPEMDGFTGLQRFFLSYASIWRTKNRDELAEQYLQIDPHSPAEFRTNGIASNVDLFYDAFGVTEGDAMWLAPKDRVRIW